LVTVDDIVSPDPFTGRPTAKLYYQIGYRRYRAEAGARPHPHSPPPVSPARPPTRGGGVVLRPGPVPGPPRQDGPLATEAATVQPGRPLVTTVAAPPGGGGEIRELRISTAERSPQMLRSTRLRIAFDGETTVDTPLIDFFGTGPAWNTYSSLPFT